MNKDFLKKLVIPWMSTGEGDKPSQYTSYLEHLCALDVKSEATQQRLTKIMCSIGPASRDVPTLISMMEAGMSVARINMFYGSREYHEETLANIQKAVAEYSQTLRTNYSLAIAVDLTESGIRTGKLAEGTQVELITGNEVSVTGVWNLEEATCEQTIYVNHVKVAAAVKEGDRFFIDDGEIVLWVRESVTYGPMDFDVEARCVVERGGILLSYRKVTVPGVPLERPPVTWTDEEDLKWAVDNHVDIVLVPQARDSVQLSTIRNVLGDVGKSVHLIARIETNQGLTNIDDILTVADGVLVGRRGLSLELNPERMLVAQKAIVAKCNKAGKIVICGQQMLHSMVLCAEAIRPEIECVASAVMDGCDAVMISAATSTGIDPVRTVLAADNICRYAESCMWSYQLFRDLNHLAEPPIDPAHAIAIAVVEACNKCRAAAVCVVTTTGRSARLVARYRPRCPIIGVTRYAHTARLLAVCRGILPLQYTRPRLMDWLKDVDKRIHYAAVYGSKLGFIHSGDCLVLVSGWRQGTGFTNTMRIIYTHAPYLEVAEHFEMGDVKDAETMYDYETEFPPEEVLPQPGELPEVSSYEFERQLLNALIDNLPILSKESLRSLGKIEEGKSSPRHASKTSGDVVPAQGSIRSLGQGSNKSPRRASRTSGDVVPAQGSIRSLGQGSNKSPRPGSNIRVGDGLQQRSQGSIKSEGRKSTGSARPSSKTAVVEELPPVVEETPPVVEDEPPVVEEEPPVVEEAPPVVEESPPAVEETPPVEEEPAPAE